MLAVAALHLCHHGAKDYRNTGLSHLNAAIPKFNESLNGGLIPPKESPHILYTAMLITLHSFCIDSKSVTDSWVFSSSPDRLAWLVVQRGLAPLFGQTQKYHTDSFMTPVFNIIDGPRSAAEGLPTKLLLMCGYKPDATEHELQNNPYVPPLQALNALMPLERNMPNLLKYLRFLAGIDNTFFMLVSQNDPKALLIIGYCFALMCDIELWWTQPRARRDCWAICSFLDQLGNNDIRQLLQFPASACGYTTLCTAGKSAAPVSEPTPSGNAKTPHTQALPTASKVNGHAFENLKSPQEQAV